MMRWSSYPSRLLKAGSPGTTLVLSVVLLASGSPLVGSTKQRV